MTGKRGHVFHRCAVNPPDRRGASVAVGADSRARAVILEVGVAAGARRRGRGDRGGNGEHNCKSKRDFGHHGHQPRYVCALDQIWETPSVGCNLDIGMRSVQCLRRLAADVVELLKWSCLPCCVQRNFGRYASLHLRLQELKRQSRSDIRNNGQVVSAYADYIAHKTSASITSQWPASCVLAQSCELANGYPDQRKAGG